MNRDYKTVDQIVAENPGHKAYILMAPTGGTFYWSPGDDEPTSKVCLMGVSDK